ncbi:hypothetical protein HOD29_00885 [archaeon]|jgi:hypothetical protein|nr:hypothetical protein [archaeon]
MNSGENIEEEYVLKGSSLPMKVKLINLEKELNGKFIRELEIMFLKEDQLQKGDFDRRIVYYSSKGFNVERYKEIYEKLFS